jgi:hypothetical protein
VAIYNSLTSRTDSQSLMPEEVSNELLRTVTTNSAVMQRFRHIPVATGAGPVPDPFRAPGRVLGER